MARRADASLVGEVSLDTRKFDQGVKSVQSSMRGLADGLKAVGAAFAAWGAKELAQTGYEMAKLGAQSLRLKESFEQLADAYQGNSQAILDTLKQASQGAISETNLILGANRAMMLGLGANAEQLGKLMEVAAFRARAMGISTTQAWDNIVTGIGRKSPLILDNLGIVGLKMDENTSKAELMAQVIEQGQRMIVEAGGVVADEASQYEQLEAKWTDLKTKFAELAVPVVSTVLDVSVKGLDELQKAADLLEEVRKGPEPTVKQILLEVTYPTEDAEKAIGSLGDALEKQAREELKATQPDLAQDIERGELMVRMLQDAWQLEHEEAQKTIEEYERLRAEQEKLHEQEVQNKAELQAMAQHIADVEKEVKAAGDSYGVLGEAAHQSVTASSELVDCLAYANQLIATGAIDTQKWAESWSNAPTTVEEFARNFAILKARLAEGLIPEEQFVKDWHYVESQWNSAVDTMQESMRELQMNTLNAMGLMGQAARKTEVDYLHLAQLIKDVPLPKLPEPYKLDYSDYSTAEQFGPKATAQAALAALEVDVVLAKQFSDASKTAADDFSAKMQGANTIIADDVAKKVDAALGINDPTRGGPLDRGDAPAEWWRRLPDIITRGEGSPWAEEMRGDIAKIADFLVGPGAGEKVLADEGAMRAGAEAIQRFAEQFGYAGAAGAIELNAGVVTIDWQQAAAAMERETGLEKAVVGGEAYAAQQMGLPVTGLAVPTGVPGATAAAPGAEGGIAGSGYAVMAQDVQVLAEILQTTLMPQLTVVNDFFVTQLNLNIGVANTLLGTDIPNSITTATGSFTSFVSDALEPTTSAAAALNKQLQGLIDKLRTLADMDLGDFQPGSPTPFELGLRGINEELSQMGGAWGMITPLSGGGSAGPPLSVHLHVGAMLGREADAYRLANELLPYLNRARRVQRWD